MLTTERDIWECVLTANPTQAVIEHVHSMPAQGVVSSFKFGRSYGFLRGCLIASGVPFEEVSPQRWQRALGVTPRHKGESKAQWKNRLKAVAQQLFPRETVTLATADAILLAIYCQRKHEGTLG